MFDQLCADENREYNEDINADRVDAKEKLTQLPRTWHCYFSTLLLCYQFASLLPLLLVTTLLHFLLCCIAFTLLLYYFATLLLCYLLLLLLSTCYMLLFYFATCYLATLLLASTYCCFYGSSIATL